MKKYTKISLMLSMLMLSACSAINIGNTPEPEETEVPVLQADFGTITEGRLVPNEFVNLSFKTGGQVNELLFEEGDTVSQGDVIARLGNREQLEVAVANAELEMLSAEQALDVLYDNAEVNTALAMQAITDAQDAKRDAERYLTNLNAGSRQTDIDSSKADLVFLKDRLDNAREDYQPYENKDEDNLKRATFLSKLADAQEKYNNAVRLLNNLQGSVSDLDMSIAEADLSVAQTQLALAEVNYEKLKDGPDPDALAAAQARIIAADAGLTAANAALKDIELVAPFPASVVDLGLKVGEQVSPGQPVVLLADFSQWVVETDDLTEIEVPEIYAGQAVTVTPDALPDLELSGIVESISDLFEEKRGDVTYTARILLDEVNDQLRWGMTVVVTFEK
ncbi:MAG: HlyD family efflux transporter periplasmic adaptor subunit [Anaerolineales bacterium]|nr:HlyD family efflux transporter periplasmic adaptor subunit [Anaerolineales bacterium]